MDVAKSLQFLGLKPSKNEVRLIIWEVDDDLDGYVSHEEFFTVYKRCITDKVGLEPRKLFNLTQFLMFDKTFKGSVTVEEGVEKSIRFAEYVDKIKGRALVEFKHKEALKNKKKIPISGLGDEEEQQ